MSLNLSGNTIISLSVTSEGIYKSRITRDGLVLELDAGDLNSYPGSGGTWYDLSGNGHNFTFSSNVAWNSPTQSFLCTGPGGFTGPASNLSTWGFNTSSEHYVEAFVKMTSYQSNTFMGWNATPNTGTDHRTIFSHLGYGANGLTYYDVSGCCDPVQRISTTLGDLTGSTVHIAYRTRINGYPNREIFKNMVSMIDSGVNNTATVTWNDSTAVKIADSWLGYLYLIRVYNRPLNPYEMAENFQATRGRFGI